MNHTITFNITLTMTSDWHIGSGVGRQGSVDSLVLRDPDDLPYAPSSTVAAMWRDAAEQLAYGLNQAAGEDGNWNDLVTALFGSQPAIENSLQPPIPSRSPIPSRLSLEHLRFPEELREGFVGPARASLREALTFVKPSVRIDPRSGTAMSDMLRFQEVCRVGAILTARATIDKAGIDSDDIDTFVAFAFASLRLLERIGGGRRRGLGCCKAEVSDVKGTEICSSDKALKALKSLRDRSCKLAPAVPSLSHPSTDQVSFSDRDNGDFVDIPLSIEALSPLLIMDQRLGNVTTCLDHIPGTMFLPIVTRALRNAGVSADKITQMITSGGLSVAPAYGMIGDNRGLPMPMRWHWKKEEATQSTRCVKNASPRTENNDATQMQHPKGGEVVANGKTRSISHVVRTHNTVSDAEQKPNEDVGGVYTYEAICAGEKLASVVRLPKSLGDDKICKFREKVAGTARIGAVTGRGYGSVRLAVEDDVKHEDDAEITACKKAVLWLISDFCLPSAPGSGIPLASIKQVSVQDQIASALQKTIGCGVKVTHSWMRTRRHDSWHRQWGLPRPSLTLVRAGSVVFIERTDCGEFTSEELQSLERFGSGERIAEGFGQIRVNPSEVTADCPFSLESAKDAKEKKDRRLDKLVELSDNTDRFARVIETEAWKTYIRACAEEVTATDKDREHVLGWTRTEPTASQLGKMRALLNGPRTENDRKTVSDWLDTKPEGWGKAADKVKSILDDPFSCLESKTDGFSDAPSALTRSLKEIKDIKQDDKDDTLKLYAIAAIMNAALHAHRRDAEKPDSENDPTNTQEENN